MRRLAILATCLAVGCSTADNRDRPDFPQPARAATSGLDLLPPVDWWHQPLLADAVRLTSDQMSALDKIAADQSDGIARLDRDSMVAMRDLRALLESNQPASADIVTAGQRVRSIRDSLFDRQLQMLAAERQVLTLEQWQALQQQLQERRSDRMRDQGYPRRGGRGMGGGRGRRPGM